MVVALGKVVTKIKPPSGHLAQKRNTAMSYPLTPRAHPLADDPPSLATLIGYTRSSLRRTWVVLCLLVLSLYGLAAFAETAVDGFNPAPNGRVNASLVQPDGKILVGGSFRVIGGVTDIKGIAA
jgi:hypothetical protein